MSGWAASVEQAILDGLSAGDGPFELTGLNHWKRRQLQLPRAICEAVGCDRDLLVDGDVDLPSRSDLRTSLAEESLDPKRE